MTNTKKSVKTGKSLVKDTKPINLVSRRKLNWSPVEEISDLLDNLSLDACVERTRQLLAAVPTLPTGAAHSRAVLETEQFGFTPKHSMSLHLPRIVERVTRSFGEKRLAGTVS